MQNVLERIVSNLRNSLQSTPDDDEPNKTNAEEESYIQLLVDWSELLEKADEADKKVIVVVDGLNIIQAKSKVYKVPVALHFFRFKLGRAIVGNLCLYLWKE